MPRSPGQFTLRRVLAGIAILAVLLGGELSCERTLGWRASCFQRAEKHRQAEDYYDSMARTHRPQDGFHPYLSRKYADHAAFHARLRRKWEEAASHPWRSVEPDPPHQD